jgi:hypothetical protein
VAVRIVPGLVLTVAAAAIAVRRLLWLGVWSWRANPPRRRHCPGVPGSRGEPQVIVLAANQAAAQCRVPKRCADAPRLGICHATVFALEAVPGNGNRASTSSDSPPREVNDLLARGKFIPAVRRVRELTGLRLIDAKRLVNSLQR